MYEFQIPASYSALPLMSIGRSFFAGVEPTRGFGPFKIYDRKKANEIAVKAVQDFGITRIDDGDHFAVLIRGAIAADIKAGDKSREEIADLMAGGESMADPEANIGGHMETPEDHAEFH